MDTVKTDVTDLFDKFLTTYKLNIRAKGADRMFKTMA